MTVYGNFEASKKIHNSHHGSVWSARTAGSAEPPNCCVKVIELNPTMVEQGDTGIARHLLVAAALQQAMGNKSAYWAPVYGLGSQGTNGFYVTRLYARSAQSLVETKTKLSSAELKTLLLEVLEGVMDLEQAFHRSHGNLKPSNVLIGDRSKIRKGAVFLADPDASNEDIPSLTRTPDSKAIGELIYALVTHKPHVTARWPLTKTPHWKQLGSSGNQWFSLCDDLLNTVSRRGLPTLERVRERVEAINPTRRRVPRTIFALIALGGIAAAAYAGRDQIPAWYQSASAQVSAFIAGMKPRAVATTRTPSPAPPGDSSDQPATHPALASNTRPDLNGAAPPVKPAVIPAPLPQHPSVSLRMDDEGTRVVEGTLPPELQSEAARNEFILKQNQFALSYAGYRSATVLSDWARILAKIQALESSYPPLDPASTAGWPSGLASVMNVRRDAALVRMIDSAFDGKRIDSDPFQQTEDRVEKAATAVVAARESMARGEVLDAEKSIRDYRDALKTFPDSDADLRRFFAPINNEFAALTDIQKSSDRAALAALADSESTALATRVAAWYRMGNASGDPWPADLATLSGDDTRADRLITLLREAGSVTAADQVTTAATTRCDAFFARLKTQASVAAALRDSNDSRNSAVLAKSPVWFRYDAALFTLKTTSPGLVTDQQKKTYSDLAAQVDAPGVQLVHDVLQESQSALPRSLTESGPASVRGWQLRAGWTREHCTYVSPAGTDTLEFIHVHVPDDPNGIDCYLCTTDAPVALMRHLLNGNLTAFNTAETLNASPVAPKPGMRIWRFNDATGTVDLDDADYRKCFIVSPNDQLPLDFVTPQTAFYLARRLGCRLPTSHEWLAALSAAKNSTDTNMRGFATLGFRLRDRQFARLLTNPNRDPAYWPDDNIFVGDTGREIVPRGGSATIWQVTDLAALSGRSADTPTAALWPLSTLVASSGFGFRSVGDTDNYAGVFHDLIGNVAEYTMDSPVTLAEKVQVAPSQPSGETVRRINDWFSPDHLKTVAVIGGSALSPPNMDPLKPYPLPEGENPTVFSDVGFRLTFTDPASIPNARRAVIGEASYLTAP